LPKGIFDAIVIGAGGMGSAVAYSLACSGAKTLLLEQYSRGHAFGSSHGDSRVIRFAYEKKFYVELMKSAYTEWRNLEAASGKKLLFINGGVTIAPKGHDYVVSLRDSMDAEGVESEWWDRRRVSARFPQLRIDDDACVLWQEDTGFLYASECVLTHLRLAESHGAEILEGTCVIAIKWQGSVPEVIVKGKSFRARKVIVTAGPWTTSLLTELELPLTVTRQQIVYYRPTDANLFQPGQFPVFIDITQGEFIYGLPIFRRSGVKVARHGLGETVSPDTCDRTPDTDYVEHLRDYLKVRIPDAAGEMLHAQVCLYTETLDGDFIIDAHPHCPHLIIAAGFSGHGFKFCSLVGRILAEMALAGQTSFDIRPFRLARFQRSEQTGLPSK
jgi:monomeric sarcosine oxidase